MANFKKLDELAQMGKLFEDQPEVDKNVRQYKEVLRNTVEKQKALDGLVKEIDDSVTNDMTLTPSKKYEREKYVTERLELNLSFQTKVNYLNAWLRDQVNFNAKFAELTIDCNENFDEVFKKVEDIAKTDIPLTGNLNNYKHNNFEDVLNTIIGAHGTTEPAVVAIKALVEGENPNYAIKNAIDTYYDIDDAGAHTPELFIKHMQHMLQKYKNEFYLYIKSLVLKAKK